MEGQNFAAKRKIDGKTLTLFGVPYSIDPLRLKEHIKKLKAPKSMSILLFHEGHACMNILKRRTMLLNSDAVCQYLSKFFSMKMQIQLIIVALDDLHAPSPKAIKKLWKR